MWTLWIQEINCFGKTVEFVNFETVEDNVDDVINANEGGEVYKNVNDGDFIYDENNFDKDVEDYYAFTNVSRSVE